MELPPTPTGEPVRWQSVSLQSDARPGWVTGSSDWDQKTLPSETSHTEWYTP